MGEDREKRRKCFTFPFMHCDDYVIKKGKLRKHKAYKLKKIDYNLGLVVRTVKYLLKEDYGLHVL